MTASLSKGAGFDVPGRRYIHIYIYIGRYIIFTGTWYISFTIPPHQCPSNGVPHQHLVASPRLNYTVTWYER